MLKKKKKVSVMYWPVWRSSYEPEVQTRTPVGARYLLYTRPDRPRDPHNLLYW